MRFMKWLHPGLHIKRWLFLFGLGMMFSSFGIILTFNYQWLGEVEEWAFRLLYEMTGHYNYTILGQFGYLCHYRRHGHYGLGDEAAHTDHDRCRHAR